MSMLIPTFVAIPSCKTKYITKHIYHKFILGKNIRIFQWQNECLKFLGIYIYAQICIPSYVEVIMCLCAYRTSVATYCTIKWYDSLSRILHKQAKRLTYRVRKAD